jgi:hypothetical protein
MCHRGKRYACRPLSARAKRRVGCLAAADSADGFYVCGCHAATERKSGSSVGGTRAGSVWSVRNRRAISKSVLASISRPSAICDSRAAVRWSSWRLAVSAFARQREASAAKRCPALLKISKGSKVLVTVRYATPASGGMSKEKSSVGCSRPCRFSVATTAFRGFFSGGL